MRIVFKAPPRLAFTPLAKLSPDSHPAGSPPPVAIMTLVVMGASRRPDKLLAGYPHWREPWLHSHAIR